jgi:hypothetical protein
MKIRPKKQGKKGITSFLLLRKAYEVLKGEIFVRGAIIFPSSILRNRFLR